MSELFSTARREAEQAMMFEKEAEAMARAEEGLLPEDQMNEIMLNMFEVIQDYISGVKNQFEEEPDETWVVEMNVIEKGGYLEVVFREKDGAYFNITYTIGRHSEMKKDGIVPEGLSFDLEEGVKFNVTIASSASENMAKGVGSYIGVLEVTRKLVAEYLKQHFIDIARLEVQQQD